VVACQQEGSFSIINADEDLTGKRRRIPLGEGIETHSIPGTRARPKRNTTCFGILVYHALHVGKILEGMVPPPDQALKGGKNRQTHLAKQTLCCGVSALALRRSRWKGAGGRKYGIRKRLLRLEGKKRRK